MDEERARRERELAERIEAGDARALEEVYDNYAPAIYRQALAILGSAADAEDVLQDVLVNLVRRRGRTIRELKAYLLTAARHQAYSTLRRRRREGECVPDAAPLLADAAAVSLDAQAVHAALQALPEEQRAVVVLKVYEQWTFEEIGRAVRASVNTVASRYRYAIQKLRKTLGDPADGS